MSEVVSGNWCTNVRSKGEIYKWNSTSKKVLAFCHFHLFAVLNLYAAEAYVTFFFVASPGFFSADLTDGSPSLKQMVFGVVTAVDLLNFVTGRERRERSLSECTDELNWNMKHTTGDKNDRHVSILAKPLFLL